MTKDEALKMARTALGVQLDALLGKAGHLRNDDRRRYAENGIKAIDEALAQPEQEQRNVTEQEHDVLMNSIKASSTVVSKGFLAQPEQEPVAWISATELLVMRGNALGGSKDWRVNIGLEPEEGDVGLYTTPPQRTWVGLTEDDKVLIKHDANYNQFMTAGEYADRVQQLTEARLKDKNT